MKGLNLSPGRIDEISTLSKEQREDSLAGDLSKNTTQFREHISLRSGWVIGEESEDMSVIKCNDDAMTSGRRDPSNRSISLRVHKLWDFSPYIFNSSPDGFLETYWLETATLQFLREA